jgi:Fanconi anemia group M protein
VELTSALQPDRRRGLWSSKRAFFCTPQILENDLAKGVCPEAR